MISSTLSTQLVSIKEDSTMVAKRKKAVVSFATVVKAKKVQHHNDMSPDEKDYIWYDDEDLIRIHVENEAIITQAVNGSQLQDDQETTATTRGLERQIQEKATSLGKKNVSIRKLNVAACFDILKLQQQGCCPQVLAEKAMQCSLPNVLAARSTGVHDELTARDIYNEQDLSSSDNNSKKNKLLLLGDTQECYNRATNLRDRRRQRMRQIACKAA